MTETKKDNLVEERWLRFVSPTSKRAVLGIEMIQKILEAKGFRVDHADFQVINKKEIKRPINPKFKDGPKETVIVEERVNINTSLKYLRQLALKTKQSKENLLLLQIERIKGEAIGYPLLLPTLFDRGFKTVITGTTQTVQSQLLAKPDPNFENMPSSLVKDKIALDDLLGRAKRKKGMQSTARELLNISGFKLEVMEKINGVALSKPEVANDTEMVNLILFSDIYSRYQPLLTQFWNDVQRKASPVAVLGNQFAQLMNGLPITGVLKKLRPFLNPEKQYKTFETLFAGLFQCLQEMEHKHFEGDPRLYNPQTLASTLKGIVVIGRSQIDPDLWKQCVCFYSPDDERGDNQQALASLATIADELISQTAKDATHSNQSLQDIFDTANTDRYIQQTPVHFNSLQPKQDSLFRQTLAKQWGYQVDGPKEALPLFGENQPEIPKFSRSLKGIGSIYGYALYKRLKTTTVSFFKPGLNSLKQRFGEEFFEICYFKCVLGFTLPVSRTQFAHWLKQQGLVKSFEGLGYQEKDDDKPIDPWLTDAILSGSRESMIPKEYGPDELAQAFSEAEQQFLAFFNKLENHKFEVNEELNPANILNGIFNQGLLDVTSPAFRKAVNQTYLGEELQEVIQNVIGELKVELQTQAKKNKVVLMLPAALKGFFHLNHRFRLRGDSGVIQAHLLVSSHQKTGNLAGIHKLFSSKVSSYLTHNKDPYRVGLIQAIQILAEYQQTSQPYLRFLGLLFFDRFLEAYHQKEARQTAHSPEQIKAKLADSTKLLIGQVKVVNLNKLLNFADSKLHREIMPMQNQSLAQVRQTIFYHQNTLKSIQSLIKDTSKLLNLFSRFSSSMQETAEYQQLSHFYENYLAVLSLPVEKWSDRVITALGELTLAIKKKLGDSEGMDAPGARLQKEWMSRFPEAEMTLKPHRLFSHERIKTDNLLFELTQSRNLLVSLKNKRCIIFAPERGKQGQTEQILEIAHYLRDQCPKAHLYLEDSALDDENRDLLAQEINPKNFFDCQKL